MNECEKASLATNGANPRCEGKGGKDIPRTSQPNAGNPVTKALV